MPQPSPPNPTTFGACELPARGSLPPCILVVFGASGDLASRKLLPALFSLFVRDRLPETTAIVGCGRSVMDDDAFRSSLPAPGHAPDRWPDFAATLRYQQLTYDDPAGYQALAELLRGLEEQRGAPPNRLFYLAVPPALYPVIAAQLGQSGLAAEKAGGWTRIVVEKPFGRDSASATELDRTLHQSFREEQIFRIDHYLAKETVQNVLMLRFANTLFEPLWNRGFIDHVGIVAAESLGVEHRAGYYDTAGVLRDMFQNHMLQLLALIAMEPPSRFEAERVQDEKAKVFRSLKPFDLTRLGEDIILGQYGPGRIDGREVPGYRDEAGVARGSLTPTFAMLRLFVDNWRWRGVPFYLISGKRMARKETRMVIQFKGVPHSMFRNVLDANILANRLVLGVHPEERVTLSFQTKSPGSKECLQPVNMEFQYQHPGGRPMDAYEQVLLDCLTGDHMLFWRHDGVELSWEFLSPVIEGCETCGTAAGKLLAPYPAGSLGPETAAPWVRRLLE
ncbi:MAG: glucose-6-phosphate dehydrogenase [Thermodesulfobacteriota bacterium]